jgi:hypothetical protein
MLILSFSCKTLRLAAAVERLLHYPFTSLFLTRRHRVFTARAVFILRHLHLISKTRFESTIIRDAEQLVSSTCRACGIVGILLV